MSTLVAIVYPSEQKAEEVRSVVFDLAKRYLIKFNDVVIATRDDKGRVKLNQLINTTASGAAGGSFWGLLIGLIFLIFDVEVIFLFPIAIAFQNLTFFSVLATVTFVVILILGLFLEWRKGALEWK